MRFIREFPFGVAALAILVLAVLSGGWLLAKPATSHKATLRMWVFAKAHYDFYVTAIPRFEKEHPGVTVDVQLVSNSSLPVRLQAAFLADADVPDLAEIEISNAGSFFRGPMHSVGWLDLTDRIHQSGLWDRMVQARFSPYMKQGRIFGLPHDVHPTCIAYNRAVFDKEGVDVSRIQTWDDFIKVGRKLTRITGDPRHDRYMIELSDSDAGNFETLLFQRGGGYFDPEGHCILDNEAAVKTMEWYVPLVAGPKRIGYNLGAFNGQSLTQAVEDGYILCLIAPDWRTKGIEQDIPRMAGKMALMPFPAVAPGKPRTSTWGGTMLGITKRCKNPDLAWDLARFLYTNPDDLAQRFEMLNIVPPLRDAWKLPAFDKPRPYWSNQPLGRIYANLAPYVPFQYSSPFLQTAKGKLGEAVADCVRQYRAHGDAGFEAYCRARLKQSGDQVRRLIARNPY